MRVSPGRLQFYSLWRFFWYHHLFQVFYLPDAQHKKQARQRNVHSSKVQDNETETAEDRTSCKNGTNLGCTESSFIKKMESNHSALKMIKWKNQENHKFKKTISKDLIFLKMQKSYLVWLTSCFRKGWFWRLSFLLGLFRGYLRSFWGCGGGP